MLQSECLAPSMGGQELQGAQPLEFADGPYNFKVVRLRLPQQLFVGVGMEHVGPNTNPDPNRWDVDVLCGEMGDFFAQTYGRARAFVCEGSVPILPLNARPADMLEQHVKGEVAFIGAVAQQKGNTLTVVGDGRDHDRAGRLLAGGFSPEQVLLASAMREATVWKPALGMSFSEHIQTRVLDRYSRSLAVGQNTVWHRFSFSAANLSTIYRNECHRTFGPDEAAFCYDQMMGPLVREVPPAALSNMQRLTLADNANRRLILAETNKELWRKGYSIITEWGWAHFPTLVALARKLQATSPRS